MEDDIVILIETEMEEGKVIREGKSSTVEEEEKGGGGGLINHLISTLPASLVHPLSPKSRQVHEEEEGTSDTHQVKDESKGAAAVESTTNGGGIINNLISSFFHPSEGGEEEQEERDELQVDQAEATQAKKGVIKEEEEGSASGGLIHNLVSHLPLSLPDDGVPAADEAAILIHSIIHD